MTQIQIHPPAKSQGKARAKAPSEAAGKSRDGRAGAGIRARPTVVWLGISMFPESCAVLVGWSRADVLAAIRDTIDPEEWGQFQASLRAGGEPGADLALDGDVDEVVQHYWGPYVLADEDLDLADLAGPCEAAGLEVSDLQGAGGPVYVGDDWLVRPAVVAPSAAARSVAGPGGGASS